jgi:NADH-quinone oxidoreductase subunit J
MEFYLLKLFGVLMILSSFFVIAANNPVHSVISLVFVFFNASAIFFILGFEYLALVLLIVYVGAIAVLFLFVVMMLNIRKYTTIRISGMFGLVVLSAVYSFLLFYVDNFFNSDIVVVDWAQKFFYVTDMELIGQFLFTYWFGFVLLAGLILLVAMVGSILLTMVHSSFVKRQVIYDQVIRMSRDAVSTYNVETRKKK